LLDPCPSLDYVAEQIRQKRAELKELEDRRDVLLDAWLGRAS
jgi:hypothetical protein